MTILYYIHDPMCSWCWGFKPVWTKLQENIPSSIQVKYLLGGLAKDSKKPMSPALQASIKQTWSTIQHDIPGINFNYEFWTRNIPQRSTYPACRAVIAARKQKAHLELEIINKIQRAYYLEAQNPSDINVLIKIAKDMDLHIDIYTQEISSTETHAELNDEINLSRALGVQGFPSLILNHKDENYSIDINYTNTDCMLDNIKDIVTSLKLNPY